MNYKEVKKDFYYLFHPKVTFLLTTRSKDGKDNVMSVAWITPISEQPPKIGMSVWAESLSANNIKETKEFVLNIPSIELKNQVWICGTNSGRKIDKFKKANLTKENSYIVNVPRIKECIGHIECKLENFLSIGECYFFIADVVYAQVASDFFDGFWIKDALLLHLAKKNFVSFKKV